MSPMSIPIRALCSSVLCFGFVVAVVSCEFEFDLVEGGEVESSKKPELWFLFTEQEHEDCAPCWVGW